MARDTRQILPSTAASKHFDSTQGDKLCIPPMLVCWSPSLGQAGRTHTIKLPLIWYQRAYGICANSSRTPLNDLPHRVPSITRWVTVLPWKPCRQGEYHLVALLQTICLLKSANSLAHNLHAHLPMEAEGVRSPLGRRPWRTLSFFSIANL